MAQTERPPPPVSHRNIDQYYSKRWQVNPYPLSASFIWQHTAQCSVRFVPNPLYLLIILVLCRYHNAEGGLAHIKVTRRCRPRICQRGGCVFKGNSEGIGCKVIYEEGLPNILYVEMRKYLVIFEETVSHIWLCNRSRLNFLLYEENLIFFFISVVVDGQISSDQNRLPKEWRLDISCNQDRDYIKWCSHIEWSKSITKVKTVKKVLPK